MNPQPHHTPPVRLLLVASDPVDSAACRRVLARSGGAFALHEAGTVAQGIVLVQDGGCDCVLLEQRRPDWELLAELAGTCERAGVPVVVLAGAEDAGVGLRALESGAADYVVATAAGLEWLPAAIFKALRESAARRVGRAALAELGAVRAQYRGLVEQMPAIVYLAALEPPGRLLYLSPRIADCLGYPAERWREARDGLLGAVHPEDRPRLAGLWARTWEDHAPLRAEYRMLKRDGRVRWMLDEARVVRDELGRPLFVQGLLVDITEDKENERDLEYYRHRLEDLVAQRTEQLERQSGLLLAANQRMDLELCHRKQAEAKLRASEARFRLLLESVGEGILGMDRQGRCTFINRAARDLLGCEDGWEPVGQDLLGFLCHCQGEVAEPCPLRRTLRDGVPARFDETLLRSDGTHFVAEFAAYPLRIGAEAAGAVVVLRDIGEARAFIARLAQGAGFGGHLPGRLDAEWPVEAPSSAHHAPRAEPLRQVATG